MRFLRRRQWIVPWCAGFPPLFVFCNFPQLIIFFLLTQLHLDLLPAAFGSTNYYLASAATANEEYCDGFDIRHTPTAAVEKQAEDPVAVDNDNVSTILARYALQRLRNCTVVEGNVRLLALPDDRYRSSPPLPVFRNVVQITGVLKSVGDIFPNLRVIGGESLLVNRYAFILYENPELRQLNLPHLREITNGGVRIVNNPNLCNVNNINWKLMCRNTTTLVDDKKNPILIQDNQRDDFCPSYCTASDPAVIQTCSRRPKPIDSRRDRVRGDFYCINETTCQSDCTRFCNGSNVCLETGENYLPLRSPILHKNNETNMTDSVRKPLFCCDPECAGSCTGPRPDQCSACRNVNHRGTCLRRCPSGTVELLGRRCLTHEECRAMMPVFVRSEERHFKVTPAATCTLDCPPGSEEDPTDPTNCLPCPGSVCAGAKRCHLGIQPNESPNFANLIGCQFLNGNLDLTMINDNSQLNEYVGDLEDISGYLKILASPDLISLTPFKSLKRIHGRVLHRGKYAIAIEENEHLRRLFGGPANRTIEILNGSVLFHNNPLLCQTEIDQISQSSGWSTIGSSSTQADRRNQKLGRLNNSTRNKNNTESEDEEYKRTHAICSTMQRRMQSVETDSSFAFILGDGTKIKNLTTIDVGPSSAVFQWTDYTPPVDFRSKLGFKLFYKKLAEDEVADKLRGRSMCNDNWMMKFQETFSYTAIAGKPVTVVQNLEPSTLYAAYVQAYFTESHNNVESEIFSFRTKFGEPSPPVKRDFDSLKQYDAVQRHPSSTETSVTVEWGPPLEPRGRITHYKVEYQIYSNDLPQDRNYCRDRRAAGKDTCSAVNENCCNCTDRNHPDSPSQLKPSSAGPNDGSPTDFGNLQTTRQEKSSFENALFEHIFITKNPDCPKSNRCRGINQHFFRMTEQENRPPSPNEHPPPSTSMTTKRAKLVKKKRSTVVESETIDVPMMRQKRDIAGGSFLRGESSSSSPVTLNNKSPPSKSVNVTDLNFTVHNLMPYTKVSFKIVACQDPNASVNHCSQNFLVLSSRTIPNKQFDAIPGPSLSVTSGSTTKTATNTAALTNTDENDSTSEMTAKEGEDIRIRWNPPVKPNDLSSPPTDGSNSRCGGTRTECICVTHQEYKITGGFVFRPKTAGKRYSIIIQAESLAGYGPWTTPFPVFVPQKPLLSNWAIVTITIGVVLGLCLFAAAVGLFVRNRVMKNMPQYLVELLASNRDYIPTSEVYKPDHWEMNREDIEISEVLGTGTFGAVYLGHAAAGKSPLKSVSGVSFEKCAVKMVKDGCPPMERFHFLLEANVMKQFNHAEFVLNLYGIVSDGFPPLIIMELMENGNLRDYLRSRRPGGAEENVHGLPTPSLWEALHWAAMIADGMAYLEHIRFVHRDLAARNCMVSREDLYADNSPRVKIGDFGMARDIYVTNYYVPNGVRRMPVRHMSPEAMQDAKFSNKSDVWAFGVVLWEIATLGVMPYAGLGNGEIIPFVYQMRRTMEKPTNCPNELYDLMSLCWTYDSRERPSFFELVNHLSKRLRSPFREEFEKVSFFCTTGCGSTRQVSSQPGRGESNINSSATNPKPQKVSAGDSHPFSLTTTEIMPSTSFPPKNQQIEPDNPACCSSSYNTHSTISSSVPTENSPITRPSRLLAAAAVVDSNEDNNIDNTYYYSPIDWSDGNNDTLLNPTNSKTIKNNLNINQSTTTTAINDQSTNQQPLTNQQQRRRRSRKHSPTKDTYLSSSLEDDQFDKDGGNPAQNHQTTAKTPMLQVDVDDPMLPQQQKRQNNNEDARRQILLLSSNDDVDVDDDDD